MHARTSRREALSLKVVATHHGQTIQALLRDLSMIMTDATVVLCAGDVVGLAMPGIGTTQGTLAWIDSNFGGVQFLQPLEEAAVTQLRQVASRVSQPTLQDQFGRQVGARKQRFGL